MPKKKEDDGPILISYNYVGKKVDFLKELLDSIPDQFKPSSITVYALIIIFTIVISIGIINSLEPVKELANFDVNNPEVIEIGISVGYPMPFFYSEDGGKKIKMSALALIVDTLVYLIISYLLDILIKFIISLKLGETEEEKRRHPKVFQFKQRTTSQKIADKVITTQQQKNTPPASTQDQAANTQTQNPNTSPKEETTKTKTQPSQETPTKK